MSTYILIHGAWHGAWCWDKVTPLLRQAGHQVIALDLPGHGQNTTPIAEVTLDLYTQYTGEAVTAQKEPVILVGHSLGGVVISQVAERYPEAIQKLVYLSAPLLSDGENAFQAFQSDSEAQTRPDDAIPNETGTTLTLRPERLKDTLYSDCSDEDIERAKQLLGPEAIQPLAAPVHVTNERFGQVHRVYIETLKDRVVSRSHQKQMYTALPCQKVLSLDTGHSSFFSAPATLAKLLLSV